MPGLAGRQQGSLPGTLHRHPLHRHPLPPPATAAEVEAAEVPTGALTADDFQNTPEDLPSGAAPATAAAHQEAQAAQEVQAGQAAKGAGQASLRLQPF